MNFVILVRAQKEICVRQVRCPQKYIIRLLTHGLRITQESMGCTEKLFVIFFDVQAVLFTFIVLNAPFTKTECLLIHF